jgi:DNA-binding transcriptional MerR regulator
LDLEELFSIGEASKITGISIQMLRNYANMGIVEPETVDKFTGYRYYTINQLHILDKIKYLRGLDIPVNVIADAIKSDDNSGLRVILEAQLSELNDKIEELKESEDIIKWHINSIDYQSKMSGIQYPYIKYFHERYAIGVPYSSDEGYEGAEIRLARIRHNMEIKDVRFFRQYGYVLKTERLKSKEFIPETEFMFIKSLKPKMPKAIEEHLMVFPEGEYLCFWDDKKFGLLSEQTIKMAENKREKLIAIEYSEGLSDYGDNLRCEFQIFTGSNDH